MSPLAVKAGIGVALTAIILLDIYLAADKRKGNTYSEVLRGWFGRAKWIYYTVAFWLGALMGHWGMK